MRYKFQLSSSLFQKLFKSVSFSPAREPSLVINGIGESMSQAHNASLAIVRQSQ